MGAKEKKKNNKLLDTLSLSLYPEHNLLCLMVKLELVAYRGK
jgi:hypothetical protein